MTGDEFRTKVYILLEQCWPIHDGCQKALVTAGYDDEALAVLSQTLYRWRADTRLGDRATLLGIESKTAL